MTTVLQKSAEAATAAVVEAGGPLGRHAYTLRDLVRTLPGRALAGAEVGVAGGATSALLLATVRRVVRLLMVDPHAEAAPAAPWRLSGDSSGALPQSVHDDFGRTAEWLTGFAAGRRTIILEPSAVAVLGVDDASLDFVYLDADHTYDAVRGDIACWWPKVRPGGLIAGHDYANPGYEDPAKGLALWGVKRAADAFAAAAGLPLVAHADMVWSVRKPA